MPIQRKCFRSVKDIKTHAGSVGQTFYPHKAFMKISCLEMERAHRIKEREGARLRIKVIDDRLNEIDREKNVLLDRINIANTMQAGEKEHSEPDDALNKKTTNKNSRGLVLRY